MLHLRGDALVCVSVLHSGHAVLLVLRRCCIGATVTDKTILACCECRDAILDPCLCIGVVQSRCRARTRMKLRVVPTVPLSYPAQPPASPGVVAEPDHRSVPAIEPV